ncbi:hypothetical protein ALQ42_200078 [Pseudomonas savastanoi pv. glycinea]|uniref:Uncharacterized protein n=1 Tax=Pseudomonas savastanoi pv. glycinea TaxID=318 RepID=A0A3M3UJT3_PSESG|nr:hypothetical protein ALQ42_200078 [Pseudomonas savastanoi pv. glycinea]
MPRIEQGEQSMDIQPNQFLTSTNERVLTDDGQQGMRGKEGIGSSTERHQGHVAAAIYANCGQLDNRQLEAIIEWVRSYKNGQEGMRENEGVDSSTEQHQGHVAAVIYANCALLNNRQLDEIIEWVRLYKK